MKKRFNIRKIKNLAEEILDNSEGNKLISFLSFISDYF